MTRLAIPSLVQLQNNTSTGYSGEIGEIIDNVAIAMQCVVLVVLSFSLLMRLRLSPAFPNVGVKFLANVRYMLSPVRLSVCRLSVTFVHPTQAIEIFGNVFTPFATLAICDLSKKVLRRSSQGNPSIGD